MEYSETYLHRYAGCSCRRPHVPGILRSHDAALLQDRLQRRAVHYCPVPHGTCFCRLGYGSQRPHPDPVRLFLHAFITLPLYAADMRLPLNQVITMVAAVNPAISDLPSFIFMATIPFNLLNWGSTALWDICCHQTAGSLSGHKNRVRKRGLISHDNFESCVYNLLIGLYG